MRYKFFFLFFFSINLLFAQHPLWKEGTAKVIRPGDKEFGIFSPFRYGWNHTTELIIHPIWFIAYPNFAIKKQWYRGEIQIASIHGIYYPTLALKIGQKYELENLSSETEIPQLFVLRNEILASKMLKKKTLCDPPNYLLTLKLGLKFAIKQGEEDLPLFNYPVMFHETAVYHDKYLWYVGADLDGYLDGTFNFCVDIDFGAIDFFDDFYVEHKGLLQWNVTSRLSAAAGYKVGMGSFENGVKFYGTPLFDLIWKFERKKEKQLRLFEKDLHDDDDFRKYFKND